MLQATSGNALATERTKACIEMPRRTTKPHRAWVKIEDPTALASLLREIVDEDFAGVQAEAARRSGLKLPLFNKLCQAKKPGLNPETLAALMQLAGAIDREDRVERLNAALETPAMRRLEEDQLEWEIREWLRLRFPVEDLSAWDVRAATRRELREGRATTSQIRRFATDEGRALLSRLRADGITRSLMEDLATRLADVAPMIGSRADRASADAVWHIFRDEHLPESPPFSLRAVLALLRILQPLLAAVQAPLERSWRELESQELASYLRAATRAELILLRRDADPQRSRALAAEE